MSNTTDNIFSYKAAQKSRCRIAYVINNRQPVKCSIISDEPLFFMDFEGDVGFDEDYSDIFDFTAIESDVADLQARIEKMAQFENHFPENSPEERFSQFLDDAKEITQRSGDKIVESIEFLEKTLQKSRLAAAFLDFSKSYGTVLCYDAQITDAVYDRKNGKILINPYLSYENRILLAARELRRVWQHRNGVLLNPLTFHPDQAILVNRAQIADLSVIMIRIAWELQLAGEKNVWERIENSSMADMARAFARESYLDFRTLNSGIAQSAVFESWFLSERCRTEDKKLIQHMLADYQGYVFDTAQSSRYITAELMTALGSMPFGKNYLAPYVTTIINDTIFTEVRDRSNANFLWFIKFERSFRETEQELQTDCHVSGHDNDHDRLNNKNIRFGDHEKKSEIITLHKGGASTAPSKIGKTSKIRKAASGTVIQLGSFRQKSGDV